ncbi:putative HTH-type transcriptional regulator YusO [Defluviimonas aquaemixtae]|uniref:Putative HTH-type transcriptional regulator YusO n=1 Tax=Albidovulum aquaemixtae TaxID=1542388 RepID=A0A2R8B873_9RHOB|nr:MarR family winged helix-turn-helix transcriptional regulator [Defluviimonas aquaemixtae]SPH18827.1 putative HTH-type transcriptional regulator YusO [Defluviimonas aquaemixtae]
MNESHLPEFNLDRFTPYRVAVAAQKLSEELAKHYRQEFGISIPEWRVLAHLAHSGDVSVRDIEVRVAMEKSKVSRAASRLESAGHIAKSVNDSDRRLLQLSLTPKGRALMAKLLPLALSFQEEIEARLAETFDGFEAGIDRLLWEQE